MLKRIEIVNPTGLPQDTVVYENGEQVQDCYAFHLVQDSVSDFPHLTLYFGGKPIKLDIQVDEAHIRRVLVPTSIHERLIAISSEIAKLKKLAPEHSLIKDELQSISEVLPKMMEAWAATDPDFITHGL